MRKLVTITLAGLFLFTSCQKEDLNPNLVNPSSTTLNSSDHINGEATSTSKELNSSPDNQAQSVLEYLKEDPDFSLIYTLLVKTGFNNTMIDEGVPFTIFAPTDEAIKTYLDNNNYGSLKDVPLYTLYFLAQAHISDTTVKIQDLEVGTYVPTLFSGKKLYINMDHPKSPFVVLGSSKADIVESDLGKSNGIIHKVNGILIP